MTSRALRGLGAGLADVGKAGVGYYMEKGLLAEKNAAEDRRMKFLNDAEQGRHGERMALEGKKLEEDVRRNKAQEGIARTTAQNTGTLEPIYEDATRPFETVDADGQVKTIERTVRVQVGVYNNKSGKKEFWKEAKIEAEAAKVKAEEVKATAEEEKKKREPSPLLVDEDDPAYRVGEKMGSVVRLAADTYTTALGYTPAGFARKLHGKIVDVTSKYAIPAAVGAGLLSPED